MLWQPLPESQLLDPASQLLLPELQLSAVPPQTSSIGCWHTLLNASSQTPLAAELHESPHEIWQPSFSVSLGAATGGPPPGWVTPSGVDGGCGGVLKLGRSRRTSQYSSTVKAAAAEARAPNTHQSTFERLGTSERYRV